MPQYTDPAVMKEKFTELFLLKTRDEWAEVFEDLDACCFPVLERNEAEQHPHNTAIETFISNSDGEVEPAPAPKLDRTPAVNSLPKRPLVGEHTRTVLAEHNISTEEMRQLFDIGAVFQNTESKSNL